MKTLLKQFSRWLVAAYDNSRDVMKMMTSCASDIDNLAVIALPEITAQKSATQVVYNTPFSIFSKLISFLFFPTVLAYHNRK